MDSPQVELPTTNNTTEMDLNVFFKLLKLAKQFQCQEMDKSQ